MFLSIFSLLVSLFACSQFLPFLMAKDNSRTKSRAAKGLELYNKSPMNCSSGQSGDDRASDCSSLGRSSRSIQACSLPLRASSELTD